MSQPDPQQSAGPHPQGPQPGWAYEPPSGGPYAPSGQAWHPPGPQVGQVPGPQTYAYDPLTGLPYSSQPAPTYDPLTGLPHPPQQGSPYGQQSPRYEVPAGLTAYSPPYPQAGYPLVGYAQPGYSPYSVRPTNGLAIASLVLGILWLYWVGSILALVFGYVARQQIAQRGESGSGLAVAGIVLGWIGVGALALMLLVAMVGVAAGPR